MRFKDLLEDWYIHIFKPLKTKEGYRLANQFQSLAAKRMIAKYEKDTDE